MNNSSGIYQVDELLKAKLRGSGLEPYVEVVAHIDTEAEKSLIPRYRLELWRPVAARRAATMPGPLRGRLTVGRPALDRVVKVRILAPQPRKSPLRRGFSHPEGRADCHDDLPPVIERTRRGTPGRRRRRSASRREPVEMQRATEGVTIGRTEPRRGDRWTPSCGAGAPSRASFSISSGPSTSSGAWRRSSRGVLPRRRREAAGHRLHGLGLVPPHPRPRPADRRRRHPQEPGLGTSRGRRPRDDERCPPHRLPRRLPDLRAHNDLPVHRGGLRPCRGARSGRRTRIAVDAHAPPLPGMTWIPGGKFSMGSEDFLSSAPSGTCRSRVSDGRAAGDSRRVPPLRARDEVRDARRAPAPGRGLSDADPDLLVPGSLVFRKSTGPVALDGYRNWWEYVPERVLESPPAPAARSTAGTTTRWCTSLTRTCRRTPGGRRSCRRRPVGAGGPRRSRGRRVRLGRRAFPSGQAMANVAQGGSPGRT